MEGFRCGLTCLDAVFTLWRRAESFQCVFKAVLPRRPNKLLSRSRLKERRRRRPYELVQDYSKVNSWVFFPTLLVEKEFSCWWCATVSVWGGISPMSLYSLGRMPHRSRDCLQAHPSPGRIRSRKRIGNSRSHVHLLAALCLQQAGREEHVEGCRIESRLGDWVP